QPEVTTGQCFCSSDHVNSTPLNLEPTVCEEPDRLRIQTLLDQFDPFVQRLFGVVGEDLDGFLKDNRPPVEIGSREVDRRARYSDAPSKRVADAVRTGERGQQSRV